MSEAIIFPEGTPFEKDAQSAMLGSAIASAGQTERPYLGNPQTTEMILRDCLQNWMQGTEGTLAFRYALNADKLADIMLGRDDEYVPVKGWNDADEIGIIPWLDKHATTSQEPTPEGKIRLVFARLCLFVRNLHEAEKAGLPDEELKTLLDAELQKVAHLLVGIDLAEQAYMNPPNQNPEWD